MTLKHQSILGRPVYRKDGLRDKRVTARLTAKQLSYVRELQESFRMGSLSDVISYLVDAEMARDPATPVACQTVLVAVVGEDVDIGVIDDYDEWLHSVRDGFLPGVSAAFRTWVDGEGLELSEVETVDVELFLQDRYDLFFAIETLPAMEVAAARLVALGYASEVPALHLAVLGQG